MATYNEICEQGRATSLGMTIGQYAAYMAQPCDEEGYPTTGSKQGEQPKRIAPTHETCVRRHDVGCGTCPRGIKTFCMDAYDQRNVRRGMVEAWEMYQREEFKCHCGAKVSWTPRDPEGGPVHMVGLVACVNGHPWRILSDGTIEPSPEHAYR